MLTIRFQRAGRRNRPFFRLVVCEKTAPPKGKYIEKLGFYDPLTKERKVDKERVLYWIEKGADISDSAYNLLVKEGVIKGPKRKIKITPKKEKKKK